MRRLSFLAAAASLVIATSAGAATLREGELPGGAFGASWDKPTEVGVGFTTIEGTGAQNRFDTFAFTGLPKGAQALTFDFSAPAGHSYSYSAGGEILFSESPFRHGWDGKRLGSRIQVDHRNPKQSLTLDLADGFGGTLYLALNFTHGSDLAYAISAPSNAVVPAPAPVPVPSALLLIGAAFAALGAVSARRRRTA